MLNLTAHVLPLLTGRPYRPATLRIIAEARAAHAQALRTAVGPKAAEQAYETERRASMTADQLRADARRTTAARWSRINREGMALSIRADKLTGIPVSMRGGGSQMISGTAGRLNGTKALVDEVLAQMIETANSMTSQELRWHPMAVCFIGSTPELLRKHPVVGPLIKRASGAQRGAGSGRPRKVRPSSLWGPGGLAHWVRTAPVAAGLREIGVDGKVGNLPAKVEGCTCGGYGFNGSVVCAGHGFAVRPDQDARHPMGKRVSGRADSYLDGRVTAVALVPWQV